MRPSAEHGMPLPKNFGSICPPELWKSFCINFKIKLNSMHHLDHNESYTVWADRARKAMDGKAKPPRSLGTLEEWAIR